MFSHLHVHTEFSLLDGMCRIPDLVARARELGMDSLAITDHGAMYGVIDFYRAAREAGIKPIIGCEFYVASGSRRSKTAADKSLFHLTLLARDRTGYQNLLQLTSRAHLEGFYYKPRVDRELLAQYHEGITALSGCMQGEVARLLLAGRRDEAAQAALWHKEVFGEYYFEVQPHPIPELELLNPRLFELSDALGIPTVATNDVHYVDKKDAPSHDLMLCIQTNTTVNDTRRMKMPGDFFYLKSEAEIAAALPGRTEALQSARRVAEGCNLELEFGSVHLPEVDIPPGLSADEHLTALCRRGFAERYPQAGAEVLARLEYELDVIRKTHFARYFLVVLDIIAFARRSNILFGVRGSAAASVVLYCLGMTDSDPLAHRLVFERFLNIERKEMPDIDLDFQDDRRDEVISYVVQKHGPEHVAQIITFGTLGARAALRDVGRALGMPYAQVDQAARLVPFGVGMTLERALEESGELRESYHADEQVRRLVDSARSVEGIARHASTHAAGIVISRDPLTQYLPLQQAGRGTEQGMAMTQFTMENIARVGLLKMDLLGLANLTTLARARELIRQERGRDIDPHALPLDDLPTFELLSRGDTVGVFQLEGGGMKRCLKDLAPTVFSDLSAIIALYRPGPKDHIPAFTDSKHGLKPISYPHPALEKILQETYGIIVYQDQVLQIVQAFAGYSLGQADVVRKAMGKKNPEIMRTERQRFIEGAQRKGFSQEIAEQIFNLIEPFAGYAFNKAHSVSYATIAYQTAYLKANYTVEYMAAFLMSNAEQQDRVAVAVAECQRLKVRVLPPDVSRSKATFSIEKGADGVSAIRFGLANIKNVGAGAIGPVLAARAAGGPFSSVGDFCRRADLRGVNKKVLESLVKAGALDSLGDRGALLQGVDRILALSHQEQRRRESGQAAMFDLWGDTVSTPLPALELDAAPLPTQEKFAWERELLGVYLSDDSFGKQGLNFSSEAVTAFCGQIDADMVDQVVTVGGRLTSVRTLQSKKGQPFVMAALEDVTGAIPVTCWSSIYKQTQELWQDGNLVLLQGKVRVRGEEVGLACDQLRQHVPDPERRAAAAAPAPAPPRRRWTITIEETEDEAGDVARLERLVHLVQQYPGEGDVSLKIAARKGGVVNLDMPDLHAGFCSELRRRLLEIVPESSVREEAH